MAGNEHILSFLFAISFGFGRRISNVATSAHHKPLQAIQNQIVKTLTIILATIMAFSLFSCGQKKHDKAFQVFNEGVSLNLKSIDEQNKGNFDEAISLNRQSIDKFKETLKIDSIHPVVRSALGHSLYIDKQFKEAIHWFDQANKVNGEAAVNYREIGLCKINLGQIQEGKNDIDKAFSMDTTKEIRELTIHDLTDIGELAFQYGDGYVQQGEPEKGKDYKTFSIAILILAFDYDKSKKDIALKISDFADKLDDKETANKYKTLGGR
jgi:tetratricopeptide (TPR) repeat protein